MHPSRHFFESTVMAMTRMQRRHAAACARYRAGKQKPPTRRQAQAWLHPIRSALVEMRSGYVDAVQGYAVTRLHTGDDYARIDYAINGFMALIDRLIADTDTSCMKRISNKLANGVLIDLGEIDACLALLKLVECRLLDFTREQLKEAAMLEQIAIEFELMGLKEAA